MSEKYEYVITFHTHYEALSCRRILEEKSLKTLSFVSIKLIPVPRELGSSCGTALKLEMNCIADISFFECIAYDEIFVLSAEGSYNLLK